LETKHRPVPCNDPAIFALREDWLGTLSPEREAAKRLIENAPATHAAAAAMTAALDALTAWGCEHTSPRDADSPHALLIQARAALAQAQAAGLTALSAPRPDDPLADAEERRAFVDEQDDDAETCPGCGAVEGTPEWGTVGDGFNGYCPSCADKIEAAKSDDDESTFNRIA
jgi:hypothetical protein